MKRGAAITVVSKSPDGVGPASPAGGASELALPHLDAAYNLARWLLKSDQDAADAVHEAFVRAIEHFHTYRGGHARGWWLAIVRNCCLASLRARKREPRPIDLLNPDDNASLRGTEAAAVEDELDVAQRAARIVETLERLPSEFREVIVLRELEDCSYREIAEILEVPIGTVMSRLSRARSLLRQSVPVTSMETDDEL